MAEAPLRARGDGARQSGHAVAETAETDTAYTAATLRTGQNGLLTALHDLHVPEDADVLVLVDQFEELFRFRRLQEQRLRQHEADASRPIETVQQEAAAFVSLLLATARQTRRRVYVVLTMRSDYLGDCDAFLGLPEAINESQFLTPRMTRDQLRDAIEGPLEAFGLNLARGDWEPALVNTILNDVGTDPDQLPLMQHALMLTWWYADQRYKSNVSQDGPKVALDDYRQVGGFQSALSNHATQTLEQLRRSAVDARAAERRAWIVRKMFCLLCDFEPGGRLIRRPATIREIRDVSQATLPEVVAVVSKFASPGKNFVAVDAADLQSLGLETTVDISHEALLRQWTTLRDQWLPSEMESAAFFQRLADQARRLERLRRKRPAYGTRRTSKQPSNGATTNNRAKRGPTAIRPDGTCATNSSQPARRHKNRAGGNASNCWPSSARR